MSSRTVGGQVGGDLTNGVTSKLKLVASPGNLVDISKRFAHAAAPFFFSGKLGESDFRYHFEHQMVLQKDRF